MDFPLSDGSTIRLLAPFADMLNHDSSVKQCHVYDIASGSVSVFAGKDYETGDQASRLYFLAVNLVRGAYETALLI